MKKKVLQLLPIGLALTGIFFLLNASVPILAYEFLASGRYIKEDKGMLSPLVSSGVVVANSQGSFDLTKADNWFINAPSLPAISTNVRYYNLSIPRLRIDSAVVDIKGNNLGDNLVQYKGTALPGRPGDSVIFGHSILPQFYNPKNYLSIFSLLPTLKKGDDIVVNYDGITYQYRVEQMFEVEPTDVEILAQHYDASYLSLVTCVPPGTYLRRLVVRARLLSPGDSAVNGAVVQGKL